MKHDLSTLIHFLRAGEPGNIKIGMALDAVQSTPELCDDEITDSDFDADDAWTMRYGCLYLAFRQERLWTIRIDLRDYPEYGLPGSLDGGWMALLKQMNKSEYTLFLRQHDLLDTEYIYTHFYMIRQDNAEPRQRIANLTTLRNPF
ncbi:MAG: hypothetical protein ACPG7F_17675 [Aggregatilineales bacterium]